MSDVRLRTHSVAYVLVLNPLDLEVQVLRLWYLIEWDLVHVRKQHISVFAVIGYIFLCSPCFLLEILENSFPSGPIFFSEILDSRTMYFLFLFSPPLFFFFLFCFEEWFFCMLCPRLLEDILGGLKNFII